MLPGILIIEDETRLAKNIKTYLGRYGFDVHVAASGVEGLDALQQFKPDVVLLDYKLPDLDGLEVLTRLRRTDPWVKVIVITGHGNVQIAVQAMKAGAYDYQTKPLVLKELRMLLDKAARHERLEGALNYYRRKEAGESGISRLLGESPPMRALKQQISQLLQAERRLTEGTPPSILISGETGTGKELVARTFHFHGPRRDHSFIAINCAAIPAHLVESELFGYEPGAFTDARERKLGLVEAADQGTLFLDEVCDIDGSVQVKLLRLLEDKVVRRLGGVRDRKVGVRILSSTNRSLDQLVREGKFRSDLYFRLRVVQVELPPLRERGNDILLLAEHCLEVYSKRYMRQGIRMSPAAQEALLGHCWPGNVRELQNVIEQTVLLTKEPVIKPSHLALDARLGQPSPRSLAETANGPFTFPENGIDLEALERQLVSQALAKTGGNVTRAARLLGLSRETLRYRIEKYQLKTVS